MTSIQDFPAELLCAIFRAVQERYPQPRPSTSLSRYRSQLCSLTPLSLVCKNWRGVILEHGVLWASIPADTSRPDCLERTLTMLKRSNGAELELSVHLSTAPSVLECTRSVVTAIRHQGARIRSLHLSTDSSCVSERGTQLPETFTNAINTIGEFILPEPRPSTKHPASFFQGLRKLSLSLPSSAAATRMSTILDIMKSCAGLEHLHLTSFRSVNNDCSPTVAVQMPNLIRASLRDCDSATILSHIVTPTTAFIKITVNHRTRRKLAHTHILTAFPDSPTNVRALGETTELILEEDVNHGEFGLGLSPLRSPTPSLVIMSRSSPSEKFIPRSLSAIAAHPYFGAIRSFTFSCTSSAPPSWSIVLDKFSLLSELNTSIRHATDVVCALMHIRFDGSPLCPSLRRIRFRIDWGWEDCSVDPQLFDSFRRSRTELHCSTVRTTLHYPDKRRKEL